MSETTQRDVPFTLDCRSQRLDARASITRLGHQLIDSLRMSRRTKILLFSSAFAAIIYVLRRYRRYVLLKRTRLALPPPSTPVRLQKRFVHQLLRLLPVLVPRLRSDSCALLIVHLTTLVSRTFLSICIAHIDGAIVKSLVQRNHRDFLRAIGIFLVVSVPASFINSLIRFIESKLALAFRSKLTRHAYEAYFRVSPLL